jgi:hypothetical protein
VLAWLVAIIYGWWAWCLVRAGAVSRSHLIGVVALNLGWAFAGMVWSSSPARRPARTASPIRTWPTWAAWFAARPILAGIIITHIGRGRGRGLIQEQIEAFARQQQTEIIGRVPYSDWIGVYLSTHGTTIALPPSVCLICSEAMPHRQLTRSPSKAGPFSGRPTLSRLCTFDMSRVGLWQSGCR